MDEPRSYEDVSLETIDGQIMVWSIMAQFTQCEEFQWSLWDTFEAAQRQSDIYNEKEKHDQFDQYHKFWVEAVPLRSG